VTEYTELRNLPEDVFKCKVLWAHDMDDNPTPQHIDGQIARSAYRIVALRCTRCGRERYIYLNSRGEKIGNYYKDPIDYPKTHRYTSDELWREAIKRSVLVRDYKGGSNGSTRSRKRS
jgi:hypothetical protein